MAGEIKESWDEFEKEYDLLVKFGAKQVQKMLENVKGQASSNDISRAMGKVIDSHINAAVSATSPENLKKLTKQLASQHFPRGDDLNMAPELKADQNLSNAQRPQREIPEWQKKMDFASDPKVQDASQVISTDNDPNAAITQQFDTVVKDLKDKLKNEYKNRLAMKMTPTRKVEGPNR